MAVEVLVGVRVIVSGQPSCLVGYLKGKGGWRCQFGVRNLRIDRDYQTRMRGLFDRVQIDTVSLIRQFNLTFACSKANENSMVVKKQLPLANHPFGKGRGRTPLDITSRRWHSFEH